MYGLLIIEHIAIFLFLYLVSLPIAIHNYTVLKKRLIKFNSLYCQNDIAKIISQVSICNPMYYTSSNCLMCIKE